MPNEKMLIDTAKSPKLPYDDWKIISHDTSLGKIEPKFDLYLDDVQKNIVIGGKDLLKKLKGKKALNATVLWWLLDHQEFIPKEWKDTYVYFWGTIFQSPDGYRCALYLYWYGGRWDRSCCWLERDRDAGNPSAVLASNSLSSETLPSLPFDPRDLTFEYRGKKFKIVEN